MCIASRTLRTQHIAALSQPCIQHGRYFYFAVVLNLWMLQPMLDLSIFMFC